jgi:N-dimethylarginine dimethylaminohydrolase
MCPPDYFTVDYVINPWMAGHESSLDIDLAKRQWQLLRDTIDEYAEIVEMEPQPGLPDLVFTANAGTVYGNKAIASHFMPHERRPEEVHYNSNYWTLTKKSASKEREIACLTGVGRGYGPVMVIGRK